MVLLGSRLELSMFLAAEENSQGLRLITFPFRFEKD